MPLGIGLPRLSHRRALTVTAREITSHSLLFRTALIELLRSEGVAHLHKIDRGELLVLYARPLSVKRGQECSTL